MREEALDNEAELRRVARIAAHCGLKLIRNRRRTYAQRYCLRAMDDASLAVGKLPDGTFELIKASTKRYQIASWLPLKKVELVLASLSASSWRDVGGSHRPSANVSGHNRTPVLAATLSSA